MTWTSSSANVSSMTRWIEPRAAAEQDHDRRARGDEEGGVENRDEEGAGRGTQWNHA